MTNLNILETFRTKEELINYFEEKNQSITEEEINLLKKKYEEAQKNSNALNLQQLDKVAGGLGIVFVNMTDSQHSFVKKAVKNGAKNVTNRYREDGTEIPKDEKSLVAMPHFNGRDDITFLDHSTGRQGTNIPVEQFCRENPDLVDLASYLRMHNYKDKCPEMTDADDAALQAIHDTWWASRWL